MKKIFLAIAFCFCLSLWSQNATEKDLQGKWQLITYTTASASLDVETGKVTVDKSANTFGPEMANKLKNDMESYTEMLKTAYVEINGNNFMQVVSDSVKAGTFTLGSQGNYQTIEGVFDDGTTGSIRFLVKDNKLMLNFPIQNKTYTYKKV
ncbi:hypothetical protein AMR72_06735 [Flavobacterium psychrophilum]|nr:hypothetical protein AMR72_06735 [Flavobacterium psychrophilum]AOE52232.1 hypothetical protein ALW18_06725 [Flavobacterium psychrophilum]